MVEAPSGSAQVMSNGTIDTGTTRTRERMTRRTFRIFMPLLILFAGIVLRLALHGVHGLEGDDAFSLALSHTPLPDLVRGLFRLELDIHPPLHFLLVKSWTAVAGESLLSLRYLNILLDALTGALLVAVTRRVTLYVGNLAALLWAFNPLLIVGGWLVRMYTLLGLLAVLALFCVTRAVTGRRFWLWTGAAAVVVLLALYTHITGVVVAAAAGMALLWHAWPKRGRIIGVMGTFAIVGLLYLPFALPTMRLALSGADLGASVNPANAIPFWRIPAAVTADAVAYRADLPSGAILLLVLAVLLIDFVPRWNAVRSRGQTLGGLQVATGKIAVGGAWQVPAELWVFVLVGGAGIMALGMAGLYKPRYVVPFAPLLLLPLAWSTGRLFSRDRLTGGPLALLLLGSAILGLWMLPSYGWRDDWTAAADYINAHTLPGDVVAVVPDWGQEAMRYHHEGEAPIRGFFPQIGPSLDLEAAFGPFVADAPRIWLVRYQPEVSDPDGLAQAWFDDRCPAVTRAFPAGIQISLHQCIPIREAVPASAEEISVTFGEGVVLRGYRVGDRDVRARETRLYDESGRVLVTLFWERLSDTPNLGTPRVQLTTPGGAVYGGALPNAALPPPSDWPVGEIVTAHDDLNLNPDTPPGLYNVEVMVLGPDGAPFPARGPGAGANWFIAGQVVVR